MTEPSSRLPAQQASTASSVPIRFWRSVEELSLPPTNAVTALPDPARRNFMKLMAASLALSGAQGCARTAPEKIVPYVHGPAQSTYGKPVYFATAHLRD